MQLQMPEEVSYRVLYIKAVLHIYTGQISSNICSNYSQILRMKVKGFHNGVRTPSKRQYLNQGKPDQRSFTVPNYYQLG